MASTLTGAYADMVDFLADNPRLTLQFLWPTYGTTGTKGINDLAKRMSVTPRTVRRWFEWFKNSGKQKREPAKTMRAKLARLVPVRGGACKATIRKSKEVRSRTIYLPKEPPRQLMKELNAAVRAGDEEGAYMAFWGAYGMFPDEVEEAEYMLAPQPVGRQ